VTDHSAILQTTFLVQFCHSSHIRRWAIWMAWSSSSSQLICQPEEYTILAYQAYFCDSFGTHVTDHSAILQTTFLVQFCHSSHIRRWAIWMAWSSSSSQLICQPEEYTILAYQAHFCDSFGTHVTDHSAILQTTFLVQCCHSSPQFWHTCDRPFGYTSNYLPGAMKNALFLLRGRCIPQDFERIIVAHPGYI
jgi:hypothetical protein